MNTVNQVTNNDLDIAILPIKIVSRSDKYPEGHRDTSRWTIITLQSGEFSQLDDLTTLSNIFSVGIKRPILDELIMERKLPEQDANGKWVKR